MGMAMDFLRGQIVLFGGVDGSNALSPNKEAWTWGGTAWTNPAPASPPSGRDNGGLARGFVNDVILFGGYDGTNWLNDTWSFNGFGWTQLAPAHSPSGRELFGLAYAAGFGQIVLFGGDTA